LFWAAFYGELEKVRSLCSDPDLNINWQYEGGFTPLFGACQAGQVGVVEYLLSLKGIDLNKPMNNRTTPFSVACRNGHKEVVSVLLADPRIDPNRPRNDQSTPLYMAAQYGFLEIIQTVLASSREVDTKRRIVTEDPVENGKTAAEWARALGTIQKPGYMEAEAYERVKKLGSTIADLIDAYEKDPAKVRSQLRKQLCPRGISSHLPFPPSCSTLNAALLG